MPHNRTRFHGSEWWCWQKSCYWLSRCSRELHSLNRNSDISAEVTRSAVFFLWSNIEDYCSNNIYRAKRGTFICALLSVATKDAKKVGRMSCVDKRVAIPHIERLLPHLRMYRSISFETHPKKTIDYHEGWTLQWFFQERIPNLCVKGIPSTEQGLAGLLCAYRFQEPKWTCSWAKNEWDCLVDQVISASFFAYYT